MARNTAPITTTNGRNIAIGHYAAHSLEGTPSNNIAIGYNTLYSATNSTNNTVVGSVSAASTQTGSNNTICGASCMNDNVTGSNNCIIGYNSGQIINGGIYNIHIGSGCRASAAGASSEVIIAGTSGTTVGKGSGTCYISSPYGLYYYAPATCFLYATNFSNGRCQWANFATNNPINNFYLTDYGNGANTVIVPNQPGLYQIDVSGTVLGSGASIFGTWNNVNIRNYTHFLQSFSSNGIAYQVSFSVQSRPYTVINLSGFELQWTGATYYGGLPVFVSIRFISL